MAYVEIRREGRVVSRRAVDDEQAQRGCKVRLGKAGKVRLQIGQSRTIGKYQITLLEGNPPEDTAAAVEELDAGARTSATATREAAVVPEDQAQRPRRAAPYPIIEGYEITGRLGRGGMGTVWKATELSTQREVAIKFLGRHQFDSDRAKARFEREVALAARLTHPGIARVYASGLHRGVYYYVMELVAGIHLDKYVKQHRLTDREILKLVAQVCDAVRHAHSLGIIHRDLKPSNILVSNDGQPHVVDFGLAKTSSKEDFELTLSVEGEIAGTLAYMAPEQAAGRHGQINERTDVYSLGVILYQLLTGHLPREMKGGRYDILKRIVEQEIRSPCQYNERMDRELEALLVTALAREPQMRYPSAAVLQQDIENYLKGEPLLARSLSSVYRLRKHMSRQIHTYKNHALVACVFVGMLTLVYLTTQFEIKAERQKRLEAEEHLKQTERPAESPRSPQTEKDIVEGIVSRTMASRKTAGMRAVYEQSISDKAYVYARPDPSNPGLALVHNREAVLASLPPTGVSGDDYYYEIKASVVSGPLAYVLGRDVRVKEGSEDLITFLARDQGQWKVVADAPADPVYRILGSLQEPPSDGRENVEDKAAIYALVERINTATWTGTERGWTAFEEILCHEGFAHASISPTENDSLIMDKDKFCSIAAQFMQSNPGFRHEHRIDSITVSGPLALELGTTTETWSNGKTSQAQTLSFWAKGQSGWHTYLNAMADPLRTLLSSAPTRHSTLDVQSTGTRRDISRITDPQGNLERNPRKTYLDIVEATAYEEGENYVFTVTMTDALPDPSQLAEEDSFTMLWFVDVDRDRTTGQTVGGNDYNIHLWCSNKNGWRPHCYETSDLSKNDSIEIDQARLAFRVEGKTVVLTFPKDYLPSHTFDWWVGAWTNPFYGGGPNAARNPDTKRGTFPPSE